MTTEFKLKDAGLQQQPRKVTSGGRTQSCCTDVCGEICLDSCGGTTDWLCAFTAHATGAIVGGWSVLG